MGCRQGLNSFSLYFLFAVWKHFQQEMIRAPTLPRRCSRPSKLPKRRYLSCSHRFPVVCPAFEITKVLPSIVFPPTIPGGVPPLRVSKVVLFTMFPPLPRWFSPPRIFQSVAIYRFSALPTWCPRLRSYQSVAIYLVPARAWVVFAFEIIKLSLFIVFPRLPRWDSPRSK